MTVGDTAILAKRKLQGESATVVKRVAIELFQAIGNPEELHAPMGVFIVKGPKNTDEEDEAPIENGNCISFPEGQFKDPELNVILSFMPLESTNPDIETVHVSIEAGIFNTSITI